MCGSLGLKNLIWNHVFHYQVSTFFQTNCPVYVILKIPSDTTCVHKYVYNFIAMYCTSVWIIGTRESHLESGFGAHLVPFHPLLAFFVAGAIWFREETPV